MKDEYMELAVLDFRKLSGYLFAKLWKITKFDILLIEFLEASLLIFENINKILFLLAFMIRLPYSKANHL